VDKAPEYQLWYQDGLFMLAHLFHIQHAIYLWRYAGCQPLKQASLLAQGLDGSHIFFRHLQQAAAAAKVCLQPIAASSDKQLQVSTARLRPSFKECGASCWLFSLWHAMPVSCRSNSGCCCCCRSDDLTTTTADQLHQLDGHIVEGHIVPDKQQYE